MAQANAQLLNQYKAGKTAEQQRVIDYFCKEEGCMSKNMSDDEYSQMVIKKRDSLNLRAKALSKIGLDEDAAPWRFYLSALEVVGRGGRRV